VLLRYAVNNLRKVSGEQLLPELEHFQDQGAFANLAGTEIENEQLYPLCMFGWLQIWLILAKGSQANAIQTLLPRCGSRTRIQGNKV